MLPLIEFDAEEPGLDRCIRAREIDDACAVHRRDVCRVAVPAAPAGDVLWRCIRHEWIPCSGSRRIADDHRRCRRSRRFRRCCGDGERRSADKLVEGLHLREAIQATGGARDGHGIRHTGNDGRHQHPRKDDPQPAAREEQRQRRERDCRDDGDRQFAREICGPAAAQVLAEGPRSFQRQEQLVVVRDLRPLEAGPDRSGELLGGGDRLPEERERARAAGRERRRSGAQLQGLTGGLNCLGG